MNSEFKESDVDDILSEALAVPVEIDQKPLTYIPLAFNEGRLLEALAEILPKYQLHRAEVQSILGELRDTLYSGVSSTGLRTLHSVTKNCKRCPNLETIADLPAWNLSNPDCVFVAESSSALFQDSVDHLTTTLSSVGFSSRNICLTYVNRCKAKLRKHTSEEISNCLPFLHTEIQLMKPKLIVPLGAIATKALLSTTIELGDERGSIMWMGPWAILPTWSPGYALHGKGKNADQFENDLRLAYNFVYGRSD